jgi:hypothetical protein
MKSSRRKEEGSLQVKIDLRDRLIPVHRPYLDPDLNCTNKRKDQVQ